MRNGRTGKPQPRHVGKIVAASNRRRKTMGLVGNGKTWTVEDDNLVRTLLAAVVVERNGRTLTSVFSGRVRLGVEDGRKRDGRKSIWLVASRRTTSESVGVSDRRAQVKRVEHLSSRGDVEQLSSRSIHIQDADDCLGAGSAAPGREREVMHLAAIRRYVNASERFALARSAICGPTDVLAMAPFDSRFPVVGITKRDCSRRCSLVKAPTRSSQIHSDSRRQVCLGASVYVAPDFEQRDWEHHTPLALP
jgi:hypothetical protein